MGNLEKYYNKIRESYYSNFDSFQEFRKYIYEVEGMSKRIRVFFEELCEEEFFDINNDYPEYLVSLILDDYCLYFYEEIQVSFKDYYEDHKSIVEAYSIIHFYYYFLRSEDKLKKQNDLISFYVALSESSYRNQFFNFLNELDYSSSDTKQKTDDYFIALSEIVTQIDNAINDKNYILVSQLIFKNHWWATYSTDYINLYNKYIELYFDNHLVSFIKHSDDLVKLNLAQEEAKQIEALINGTYQNETFPIIQNVFQLFAIKVLELEKKISDEVFQNLISIFKEQNTKISITHPASAYCDELEQVLLNDNPDVLPQYFSHLRIGTFNNNSDLVNITLPIFERKSLAWNLKKIDSQNVYNAIQNIVIRMAMALPVGHLKVRIVDEDMGSNFQMLLGLPEAIKGNAIYYDSTQVSTLFDNIKKRDSKIVFDKLKNQYNNLIEYNIQNEFNYEPLELIVINGFPSSFNEQFLKYILNQIQKGCRTGCYYLIAYNDDNLSKEGDHSNYHSIIGASTQMSDNLNTIFPSPSINKDLELKYTPEYEFLDLSGNIVNVFAEKYGKSSASEINKEQINETKTYSSNSSIGIVIPIGKNSKGKSLELDFSENSSAYHGIICGTTGSGKTVMLHQIITSGASIYGPDELQFVLLDYKLGTEFSAYRNLPHARVVAIDADIEFGYETLKFLTEMMSERSELFKKYKVANLEDYRTKSAMKCPRILVIIDEFQVLLEGANVERTIADDIRKLIDSIVRLGRSFGIHLLLSTQTPSGVKWSGSTMENIALRIGLRMSNESESYLFKHKTPISSKFTQKYGKAVYNDKGGVESEDMPSVVFDTNYVDAEKVPALVEIIRIDSEKNKTIPEKRTIYENNISVNYNGKNIADVTWSLENKDISYRIGTSANIQMSDVNVEMTANKLEHGIILGSSSDNILDIQTLAILSFIENSQNTSKIIVYSDSQEQENDIKSRLSLIKDLNINYIQSKTAFLDFLIQSDAEISSYNSTNVLDRKLFVVQGISNLNGIVNPSDFDGSRLVKGKMNNILANGHKINLSILISSSEKSEFSKVFGFSFDDFDFAISVPGIKNMYKRDLKETYELQTNMGVLFERATNKETKFNRVSFT